jgi:hypothetical protein
MREIAVAWLSALFQRWQDLLEVLPEPALGAKLPVASNRIGEQLWCVVGARESYSRALSAGAWQGFACSLGSAQIRSQDAVLAALQSSAAQVLAGLAAIEWTTSRDMLLFDLLEHEAQHQGQLIRYVYGLGFEFPESWRRRWSLH